MSNALAIATVTASLKRLLAAAAGQAVGGSNVRTARPEAAANGAVAPPGIDLFLYQVLPNAALRNADLPTRRGDGSLLQRPKVALDLNYLISFRGDDVNLEPHRLLGTTARALHSAPLITEALIAQAKTEFAFLVNSDLEDAIEMVKITPLSLSLEELSKLWSIFFQIPYNLSVAYQATVIVIEGSETPQQALPVQQRKVYALPFRNAVIEEVGSAAGPGAPVKFGDTMVLRGLRLKGDVTRVAISGLEVDPISVNDSEVRVALNSPPFPANGLKAGVQGVMVIHPLMMGEPPAEHSGFQSNLAAFVLRPTVVNVNALDSTHVTVTVSPPVRTGQRANLLLNSVPGVPVQAHVFVNPPAAADQSLVAFTVAGVGPGNYLVRLQVDGAESPLNLDPSDPAYGPTVTVP